MARWADLSATYAGLERIRTANHVLNYQLGCVVGSVTLIAMETRSVSTPPVTTPTKLRTGTPSVEEAHGSLW